MNPITFTLVPPGHTQEMTIDVSALLEQFGSVPDQRKPRGVRYRLPVLLTIAVLAKLCGASHLHALAHWAAVRADVLAKLFDLPKPRMPHATTWSRLFASAVSADALERALEPLLAPPSTGEVPARASQHLALDGKTLRGTIPYGRTSAVHLLSAYHVRRGAVVCQREVGAKANELTVAPRLLAQLSLEGAFVTGDAMFAQRSLSTQIVEAGGDYCWIVKENQATLLDDLKLLFEPQPEALPGTSIIADDFVRVHTLELGHGRLDERVLTTSSLLADYSDWPYLAQAFQVVRTSQRGGRRTRDVRYGITSVPAKVMSAARLMECVRAHWRIENSLHYRRDVTLREDASLVRMKHAPQVLATLNNFVCGLTARAGVTNLASLQRAMAATVDRALFRL
jgi:predicted transposase YbfD/YdcC